MTYDKNYFTPPSGLPSRSIRALFSELGELMLWQEQPPKEAQAAIRILQQLARDEHYQHCGDNLAAAIGLDYKATCSWWEEDWRYEQSWPLIKPLFDKL